MVQLIEASAKSENVDLFHRYDLMKRWYDVDKVDAIVDVPFALPTAVSGITLTALYAKNGWLGSWLEGWGIHVANTSLGISVALVFIGLPFVVRTLQPVLEELEPELEEAAATLGANRWQTTTRVIFPEVLPAMITGFAMGPSRVNPRRARARGRNSELAIEE